MSTRRITNLNEDLEAVGLGGGIDLGLAGLVESGEDADIDSDSDAVESIDADGSYDTESAVEAVATEVYEHVRAQISDDEIDYDVDQFESDLFDAIKVIAEGELANLDEAELNEEQLEEIFRKIMKVVGGKLKMVKQKLKSAAERRKNRMQARKGGGLAKKRKAQRKYRRSGKGRKAAMKRKRAVSRAPAAMKRRMRESAADRMMDLLGESAVETGRSYSAVETELEEAYARIWTIADMLASFFEDHGEESDFSISTALTEMVGRLDADLESLEEGEDDIAARLLGLQTYGKVLSEALSVFDEYSLVEGDDEDDDEDDDDEDVCDECGEATCEGGCEGN